MEQSSKLLPLIFISIFALSCRILGATESASEAVIYKGATTNQPTPAVDHSPEILKQTGNVLMNILNLSQNPESAQHVVPALANIFHGMLNIALLTTKRSLSLDETIQLVSAYLQTDEGKKIIQEWRSMTAPQQQ
ncbi:hypothetical protein EBU24_06050 [bacterium]|nr:hypothetical protein [bacterium]